MYDFSVNLIFLFLLFLGLAIYVHYTFVVIENFRRTNGYDRRDIKRKTSLMFAYVFILFVMWLVAYIKVLNPSDAMTDLLPLIFLISVFFMSTILMIRTRILEPKKKELVKIQRERERKDIRKQEVWVRYLFFSIGASWLIMTLLNYLDRSLDNSYSNFYYWMFYLSVEGMAVFLLLFWMLYLIWILNDNRKLRKDMFH